MPGKRDEDRIVVSHVTSRRPSSSGEGPLIKPVHEAMEHGPHCDLTAFFLDLDGYVGQFNEQVIGAYRIEGRILFYPNASQTAAAR